MLPNGRHQSVSFFGAAETTRASQINIGLADSNEININSDYFYEKKHSFIHYTSVQTLLSILKEKKIRLYNLNGMDDKEEFELSLKYSNKKLPIYNVSEIKKRVFCLSMCKEELEINEESLSQWRSYAQDGYGVGIVFNFEKRYAKDWVHIMLSNVYYNQNRLDKFIEVERLYNQFKIAYNLAVTNFDEMFYRYYAFHKSQIYKSEKEVRLIYCQGFSYNDKPPIKYDINKALKETSYIELDLEWEWDEKTKSFILSQGIVPSNIRPIICRVPFCTF